MNFVKYLRTPFLQNASGRLLLHLLFCFSLETNGSRKRISKMMVGIESFPQENACDRVFFNEKFMRVSFQ